MSKLTLYLKKKMNLLLGKYYAKCYSQEGEDMVLRKIFENKNVGFYIDVGAHHPERFSNTCYFYKHGWCGINIDAMPGSMAIFNKKRKRDINIEVPVSDKKETLKYHAFNDPALNGFNKEFAKRRIEETGYKILFTKEIETQTLENIIQRHLPVGQDIDFLSIDVEGMDFKVLKSTNLTKYKPKIIMIEILGKSLKELINNEITLYLETFNYSIYSKTVNTVIFKLGNN